MRTFAVIILVALFSLLRSDPARAEGHQVCNQTSFVIYLALGIPDNTSVRTEGWTRLRPGQCRTVLPAPFADKPYYAYGYSSPVHSGGQHEWGGNTPFCAKRRGDFSINGKGKCQAPRFRLRRFNVIDVNPPGGGRTVLSEPAEYGARAELAGIQRLLKDNGYAVRTMDGYDGRRTRAAIRRFVKAQRISPPPDRPGLIDALEKAARDMLAATGLHVCNHADAPVWTAYGHRKGRKWESRGWWKLAPKSCMTLLSGLLRDKGVYLYAGLGAKGGERPLIAARQNFCTSEILFAIQGRQNCGLRGFESRAFALYRNDSGKGLTINLNMQDFSANRKIAGLPR